MSDVESPPRISIVTPSYNQARYLPETIESILNQDYPNLEYIIIDGGSTDGSIDIIKRYESHLAYWVSEKDSGQSEAINKGLGRATGELFNWINSDDILFPGALWRMAEAHTKHPEAELLVGCGARSDAEGRITRVTVPPRRCSMSPSNWSFFVYQQAVFIATEVIKRLGGMREDLPLIMDTDLYYRLFRDGCRCVRVNALIGMIREHAEAKGVAKWALYAPETLEVLHEYGIHPARMTVGRAKTKICRVFDGSYLQSFALLRKWQGQRPWDTG
ncbi:MAG: glycosyltransferase [Phycisphaerales bacterium]|nr:MAG: glycosyltransferase [Phycisphaerales bacterium]